MFNKYYNLYSSVCDYSNYIIGGVIMKIEIDKEKCSGKYLLYLSVSDNDENGIMGGMLYEE